MTKVGGRGSLSLVVVAFFLALISAPPPSYAKEQRNPRTRQKNRFNDESAWEVPAPSARIANRLHDISPPESAGECRVPQTREVLKDFYSKLSGESWKRNIGWLEPFLDHCSWYGIVCDPNTLCVIGIHLPRNFLAGTLSDTRLGEIPNLRSLDLTENEIEGPFPDWIRDPRAQYGDRGDDDGMETETTNYWWSTMVNIDLSGNNLSGTLPPDIQYLWNLRQLYLGNNSLGATDGGLVTGFPIPPSLKELWYLGVLDLSGNAFGGIIPEELGELSELGVMRLDQALGVRKLKGVLDADHPVCRLRIDRFSEGHLSELCVTRDDVDNELRCSCCTC